ncbi:MAG: lamin tail domain-containing protein [Porphyromonas sp.]|nr:lamin tail domain-containing protein [Porphyromonas sp.]
MKNHILIFALLIFSLCGVVYGATPPQSQWRGDIDAFVWQGTGLAISPDTPLSRASISHDYNWKGDGTTWMMQTAFAGVPTTRNGFRWTLFSLKREEKVLSYVITSEENGSVLLLQERSRQLSVGSNGTENVQNLARIPISLASMAWNDMSIIVRYTGARLTVSLSGDRLSEEREVELPSITSSEVISTMILEAFFTKVKRSQLVWKNIEAGGGDILNEDPQVIELAYNPEDSSARLLFSEPLDISEASARIVDESIAVSLREGGQPEELLLFFSPALTLSRSYTLNIEDLRSAKSSKRFSVNFTFSLEDTETSSSLLISEFLAKPLPGRSEYIELYNGSHAELDLFPYTLYYNGSAYSLPEISMPPRSFVVLYKAGFPAPSPEAIPLKRFPKLSNTRFVLSLFLDEEVDKVVYSNRIPAKEGQSVERLDLLTPIKGAPQWRPTLSTTGGTPGLPPIQTPFDDVETGAVVINEVLANPSAGGEEFIELYNRSGKEMDLKDLALEIRTGTELNSVKTIMLSDTSYIIPPAGFVVLTRYKKSISALYPQTDPKALYEKMNLPPLPNNVFSLHLLSQATWQVVDEMLYRHQFLGISPKSPTGTSLERVSPEAPGMESESWRAALLSVGKATPGLPNSVLGKSDIPTDEPEQAWPDEEVIPFEDILRLSKAYPEKASGVVFNLRGVPVLNIEKEALHLFVEQIKSGKNKQQLPTGIYILHIRLEGPGGKHPVQSSLKWLCTLS